MMNTEEFQNQAKYIWDRLDDLAASDPKGYEKFIDQQMKEREAFMSLPVPTMCFFTKASNSSSVYINICGWKRIPYPEDDKEPLKLMCGFMKQRHTADSSKEIVIPVAANEQALGEILKSNFDKHELILLIIDMVEKHFKMKLSKNYKVCEDLFKGDFPANPRLLFVKNPGSELSKDYLLKVAQESATSVLSSPESLIKTLAQEEKTTQEISKEEKDFVKEYVENSVPKPDQRLIEEIEPAVIEPDYTLEKVAGKFALKIFLSQIASTSGCDLHISKDEVDLRVPGVYCLKVALPEGIDDELATAKFNKTTKHLTVTMPID